MSMSNVGYRRHWDRCRCPPMLVGNSPVGNFFFLTATCPCRDGKYCGTVTTTSYGFSLGKQICLGFVQDLSDDNTPEVSRYALVIVENFSRRVQEVFFCTEKLHSWPSWWTLFQLITPDFVKTGEFEVDIMGVRYPAHCRLSPPVLPKKVIPPLSPSFPTFITLCTFLKI
jgi:hypothetical protein